MGTEKGRILHQKGGKLHHSGGGQDGRSPRAALLAEALRQEVGRQRGSVKRLMRWTGASERAVKAWLSGESQPRADHLISLMAHSNDICGAVLCAAGRPEVLAAVELMAGRSHVQQERPGRAPDLEAARIYLTKALLALDAAGPGLDPARLD
jgi:hypothetical protein